MNKLIIIVLCLIIIPGMAEAQKKINLGAGYFGHTISYPGFLVEAELEHTFTASASLPIRINLGQYIHQRYHRGIFMDVHIGFRQYLKSGFFFEESIGAGMLQPILDNDGVFSVDDNGSLQDASRILPLDFAPSLTLGMGYNLTRNNQTSNLVWLRPKLFWQIPHKTTAAYNLAIQVGYSRTIRSY